MEEQLDNIQTSKRPTFLTVLCILTFVFAGYATLSYFVQAIGGQPKYDLFEEQFVKMKIEINKLKDMGATDIAYGFEKFISQMDLIYQKYVVYYFSYFIVFLTGLIGAILMFRGKKIGFHFYIIYSILYTFLDYLFVGSENVIWFTSISGLIISGIFILMYSRNLKWLK